MPDIDPETLEQLARSLAMAPVLGQRNRQKEATRALKRQLSNVVYRTLVADAGRLEQ